jgi:hypothetical protein
MQLLYSRAAPCPEFASLSLLLKGDISGDLVSCRMGEPFILPSSVSTISHSSCMQTLKELHYYINSVYKASRSNRQQQQQPDSTTKNTSMSSEMFSEDEKLLMTNEMQVFRPLNGHGLGLHYRLLRDRAAMSQFIPLVFNASKSTASAKGKVIENEVTGVVLCVGIAGLPSTLAMSALHYSLPQRMKDCLDIFSNTGTDDPIASRALLATLLLTEDEDRMSNTMAEGNNRTLLSEADEMAQEAKKGKMNLLGRNKAEASNTTQTDIIDPLLLNSADLARIMVERLAVLSVSESDTIFRKYEAKANAVEKAAKGGRTRPNRKSARDADLDGFDFKGGAKSGAVRSSVGRGGGGTSALASTLLSPTGKSNVGGGSGSTVGTSSSGFSSPSGSIMTGSSGTTLKAPGSKVQLPQPRNDTLNIRKGIKSAAAAPLLMASVKDNPGRPSRRASVDALSAPGRPSGRPSRQASHAGFGGPDIPQQQQQMVSSDWNLTSTASGFPADSGDVSLSSGVPSRASSHQTHGTSNLRQHSTHSSASGSNNNHFDPFGDGTPLEFTHGDYNSSNHHSDDLNQHPPQFDDDLMGGRSIRSLGNDSAGLGSVFGNSSNGTTPRVQVNVALNEDLTCFYKLSKMSSCTVEGVIQVRKEREKAPPPWSKIAARCWAQLFYASVICVKRAVFNVGSVQDSQPPLIATCLSLQVQVKSTAPQGVPFVLLVRDPSRHIQSLQENKKFVESMSDGTTERSPDQKFTVSVPKADNYFPVMRYKCGNDLRPVPIVRPAFCVVFRFVSKIYKQAGF